MSLLIKETSIRDFSQMPTILGGTLYNAASCSEKDADRSPAMFAELNPNPPVHLRGPAIKPLALTTFPGGVQSAKALMNKGRSGFFKLYGKSLSAGIIVMKSPDREAVSEGIGFSGLILAASDHPNYQSAFWQIYRARRSYFLKSNGVMSWKIDLSGRKIGLDSASQADQDWIASCILVYKKIQKGEWKLPAGIALTGFKTEIQKNLSDFWNAHIKRSNGRHLFLATDGAWAKRRDGRDIYFPAYPGAYFLKIFGEFDLSHAWAKVSSDVLELNVEVLKNHRHLGAAGQNPIPAKVFVQVSRNGRFLVENYYSRSKSEGVTGDAVKDNEMDSVLFFLSTARSAILGRGQTAQNLLRKIVQISQITSPSSAHILAGDKGAPHRWGWNNTLARAAYGLALLGSGDTARAESFFESVLKNSRGDFFGEWDGAKQYYYDQALILQILDLAINRP